MTLVDEEPFLPREDSKWTLWLQEVARPGSSMCLAVSGPMTALKVAKRYQPEWRIVSICRPASWRQDNL